MKGKYQVIVENIRVRYKFVVERNLTVLRGDSATGKTTMIDMVASYQRSGEQSGVMLRADKPCVVLTSQQNWKASLSLIHESIVFIDEGETFVRSLEFAEAIRHTDNYFVIATRLPLFYLPYSTKEIYGIKNTAGNRYQGTKRLYAEFYPLLSFPEKSLTRPDLVVVEDSNSGYEFFTNYFREYGIKCVSAGGKSNVFNILLKEQYSTALVIVDGAAFGAEIERVYNLRWSKNLILYLPESFEWLILRADVLNDHEVRRILEEPSESIDSEKFFSWERFFTAVLIERSRGTYLEYNKASLNPNYLQKNIVGKIGGQMPEMELIE